MDTVNLDFWTKTIGWDFSTMDIIGWIIKHTWAQHWANTWYGELED